MKKGLLPIGTVVLLEGGTRKVMICGYSSKSAEDNKVYDYNGCIFPEGFMENIYCLFNHDQIETVYYEGLKNEEFEEYMENGIKGQGRAIGGNIGTFRSSEGQGRVTRPKKAPNNPMSASEMRSKFTAKMNTRN